jgi:hypothetical protein
MRATFTVLVALLSIVGVASAQTTETLPRGTRVRIAPATPTRAIVGRLVAVTDSSIVVRRDRGDLTIPRSVVQRLEISRGTSRAASAGRGALIGAVVGGAIGSTKGCGHGGGEFCLEPPAAAAVGGVYGAATGSLVGLVVGSIERWRRTEMPISLSLAPTGDASLSIGGRIAF